MENQPVALTMSMTVLWVILGILTSLILPVAVRTLQNAKLETQSSLWERIVKAWKDYSGNRYLGIFLAAVVVGLVLVFLLGLQFFTVRDAALAGFTWESLVNKLMAKK